MLADWYFCCCISAPPDKTAAFLSIVETLANPESGAELLRIAMAELERTDSWMRWYAVPQVLEVTHHREADRSSREVVEHFLTDIIQELPGDVGDYLRLVGLCVHRQNPSDLLAALADLAGRPLRHGLVSSDQPYLDLHEFAQKNLLLSIMADCLWADTGATAELHGYLSARRKEGALNDLLDEALDGQFGRLALRLAAKIARRVFTEKNTAASLAERVLSAPKAAVAFEPDLLHALAESLYWDRPATELVEETVALAHLPPAAEHLHPLQTLGLDGVPDERLRALSIGLWQATLWDLAAQLQPRELAESIQEAWRMREVGHTTADQTLYVPALRADQRGWLDWLRDLWRAIALDDEPQLRIQVGRSRHGPPSSRVLRLLSSPLLPISASVLASRRSLDGLKRYPTADRPVAQLRLWSGALTAVRLLQRIPREHPARPVLAQSIAQTADALQLLYGRPWDGWFANYDKPESIRRVRYGLALPVTGLALFVNRQMNLAARGELWSIDPSLFVSLFDEDWLSRSFRRFALPPRMMDWIGGAYPGGTPGAPTARWLALIPEVNASFEYRHYHDGNWDDSVAESAALAVRFLCPEALDRTVITHLDWRQAKRRQRQQPAPDEPEFWHVSGKRLLLTDALTPEDWRPQWPELGQMDAFRKLVRAVERLASLSRGQNTDAGLREQWRTELLDGLNGVVKHKDLNRYARLRLIEFIDDPVIAHDPDAQELIALTVLEHGRAFELDGLLGRLYLSTAEVSAARRHVQDRLIPAILQVTADNLTKQGTRLNPRDPRQTLYQRGEGQLLQNFVLRLVHRGATTGRTEWLRRLTEWREDKRWDRADTALRRLEVDVEIIDGQKSLLLAPGTLSPEAIRAICYDPNQYSGSVFYEDLDPKSNAVVLFGKPERDVRSFLSSRWETPPYVLAKVASVAHEPESTYPYQYRFDIGAWFRPKFGRMDGALKVGDRVLLPLARRANDPTRFFVDPNRPFLSAKRWREGDLIRLTLTRPGSGGPLRVSAAGDSGEDLWSTVEPALWDPDLSLSHPAQVAETPWSGSVFAERTAKERWRPLDRDLADWLAEWPTANQATLAVYVGPELSASDQPSWRFSTLPGQSYVLGWSLLPKADATALAEALDDCPAGLLVAFEINRDPDSPGVLRLGRSPALLAGLAGRYPDLQVPFDRRNLEWAALFADGAEHIAWRDQAWRWWIDLSDRPIPGCPSSLGVRWLNDPPPRNRDQTELSNVEWDPRSNVVYADWVHAYEARPCAGWDDFCTRWLNPTVDMAVTLDRVQGIRNDGYIGCFTDEHIYVPVAPESISMRHWNSRLFKPGRAAEIYYVDTLSQSGEALDAEDLGDLEVLRGHNELRGVVTSVPRPDEGRDLCRILWESEPARPLGMHIANAEALKLRPGMIVVATRNQGHWSLELRRRRFFARALWELQEQVRPQSTGFFLGVVDWTSGPRGLLEVEAGRLALLSEHSAGVDHLAKHEGGSFSGGAAFGPFSAVRRKRQSPRVTVVQSDGELHGLTASRSSDESPVARVVGVRMRLSPSKTQRSYYCLTRTFELRPAAEPQPTADLPPIAVPADSANQRWKTLWEQYIAKPGPLPVTSDGLTVTLMRLRVPTGAETGWTAQVSVAPWEGAYIENAEYSQDAHAYLFRDADGGILASFRRVPAFSPERFHREKMGGSLDPDKQRLPAPLYYVGPETRQIEGNRAEHLHRFEWGLGSTLLVPEAQLRFDGREFADVKLVLFYGDMVTALTVGEGGPLASRGAAESDMDDDEEASEVPRQRIFDIQQHCIEFSQGRTLYDQSNNKIVHVLTVECCGDSIRVRGVQGFNSGMETSGRSLGRDISRFTPIAGLGAKSLDRLKARWPTGSVEPEQRTILGRLDVKEFEKSVGKTLLYDHVRLTFLPDPDEAVLRDQDLIFMRSTRMIEPRNRNDIYLDIKPYGDLHPDDLGADFLEPLRLMRREFSVREELLYRIADELRAGGHKNLELNLVLLVRIRRQGNQVSVTLLHGLTRRDRALTRALQAGGGVVFGGVLSAPKDGRLPVELKPGLFVSVRYLGQVSFKRGDLVAVEQDAAGYRVAPLTPGHSRYLASGPRPAVALPLDSLFGGSLGRQHRLGADTTWLHKKLAFSLGGLPGVVAQPGTYDPATDQWSDPRAGDFIRLMRSPPPQLVTAGIDHAGRPRVGVKPVPGWTVGRLEVREGGTVLGRAFDGPTVSSEARSLDWLTLTFGDEPVVDVVARARTRTWRYHDRFTGYWTGTAAGQGSSRAPTKAMSVFDGPVFFQGEGWKLRYPPGYFDRIGYPVRELIEQLRNLRDLRPKSFSVAGVSDAPGLWIELAPGRLAELPGAMVFFRAGGQERPLARFHWQAFAAGDTVELSLSWNDIYAPDRICLVSWHAGPRRALGPARCLLPVAECDPRKGALVLGAGEFRLTLPVVMPDAGWKAAILGANNSLVEAKEGTLSEGDVVLLGVGKNGATLCLGSQRLKPFADRRDSLWATDPLARECRERPRLAALIQAVGGSLPVTVEQIEHSSGRFTFSRRWQLWHVGEQPGSTMGQVLGLLDENCLLIRVGGDLLPVAVDVLVAGLPAEPRTRKATAQALRDSRLNAWLEIEPSGRITGSGMPEHALQPTPEFAVEPLGVVDGAHGGGFLCRASQSQKLYWLSVRDLAWTQLSVEQLQEHLVQGTGIALWVRRQAHVRASETISVVTTGRAERELARLRVGREMLVRVIAKLGNTVGGCGNYLVASFVSKVMLTCETQKRLVPGHDEPVEVVRRSSGAVQVVVTAPKDEQPKLLDVPRWMLRPWPQGPRRGWSDLIARYEQPIPPEQIAADRVASAPYGLLREYLASAYRWAREDLDALSLQVRIALQWEQTVTEKNVRNEMEIVPTLFAILLLDRVGSILRQSPEADLKRLGWVYPRHAVSLLGALGLRARRSLHSEVLTRTLLGSSAIRYRDGQLGRRLDDLQRRLLKPLKAEDIETLRGFCRAAVAWRTTDFLPLAAALSAAIGDLRDLRKLWIYAPVCANLIEMSSTLPANTSRLDDHTRSELRHLVERMLAQDLDIVLLDPIQLDASGWIG